MKSKISGGQLLCVDLLDETISMAPLVHHEEYITDVDTDTTSEFRVEEDVSREALPVTVESKTDELILSVEYW